MLQNSLILNSSALQHPFWMHFGVKLTQNDRYLNLFLRAVKWNQIAFYGNAVHGHGRDTLFNAVWILYGDVIGDASEITLGAKTIQSGRDTRIDHKTIVIRADAKNVLGHI